MLLKTLSYHPLIEGFGDEESDRHSSLKTTDSIFISRLRKIWQQLLICNSKQLCFQISDAIQEEIGLVANMA